MKSTVIFGGSFDPPHKGHIKALETAMKKTNSESAVIIPCGVHPDGKKTVFASPEDRLEMCRRAFCGIKGAEISEEEIFSDKVSYTADTLLRLSEKYPGNAFYLCLGSDAFLSFGKWYKADIITKLCTLFVICRDEKKEKINAIADTLRRNLDARILISETEPYIISSSEVRREIAKNGSSRHLTPEVNDHITLSGLYGALSDPERRKIISDLEKNIPEKRLRHILSVEREAVRIADFFGFSEERKKELRLAALLHDVTRYNTAEENIAVCKNGGYRLSENDLENPAVLHQYSGMITAKEKYGLSDIAGGAIEFHTTGKKEMTAEGKILWLADFIEETRPYKACRELREEFYSGINAAADKTKFLDTILLSGFSRSIENLESRGEKVHPLTREAKKYLEDNR